MKIAIITQKFPPDNVTGAERFAYELAKELKKLGHKVLILTDKSGNYESLECKKIPFSKTKILRKLVFDYRNQQSFREISKILEDYQPDLVQVNNFYGIGTNTLKKISSRYPLLITAHDYWLVCYRATLFKKDRIVCDGKKCKCYFPLSLLHQHFTRSLGNVKVVAPSKFLLDKLRDSNKFSRISHIPNGVKIPNEKTNYSKKIIFVGRLTKEKGLQTVIKSLNKTKNYQRLILRDGTLKHELQKKYRNIDFLGFKDPKKYYLSSSIMIIPSIWQENFSYSVLEAMSYGICVIACNIGGIPEQIKHMETGLLFEPGNEKDFEAKLNYLIKNPKEIKRMGKNAREFVRKNFDWKKIVKEYEKVYREAIRENNKRIKINLITSLAFVT